MQLSLARKRARLTTALRLFHLVILAGLSVAAANAQDANNPWPADPYDANNRKPDERYKADILVVVAHPDEEVMAAAYIARVIHKGKRVSIVWTTRGDCGTNVVGSEQAAAMGDVREVEAMRAAVSLGVTNMWNLRVLADPWFRPPL